MSSNYPGVPPRFATTSFDTLTRVTTTLEIQGKALFVQVQVRVYQVYRFIMRILNCQLLRPLYNLCRNYIEQVLVIGIFSMHFIIDNFGYYISIYFTIVSISPFDNLKPFFFYLKFPIHYRVTSYLIINLKIFA